MKIGLTIICTVLVQLSCYSQSANDQEKYDTISCSHFLQAHNILQTQGTTQFSTVVDYPILQFIHDNNHCESIEEHHIRAAELKYFIFTILEQSNSEEQIK